MKILSKHSLLDAKTTKEMSQHLNKNSQIWGEIFALPKKLILKDEQFIENFAAKYIKTPSREDKVLLGLALRKYSSINQALNDL